MNENRTKHLKTGLFFLFAAILVVIDQLTKYLATHFLKDHAAYAIIPDIFELQYLENKGAAFGILQGKKVFFLLITAIMILLIFYIYEKLPDTRRCRLLRVIAVFIEAGAIGNMIDRICQDFVIDFFYFKWINFPIFNVADIYVTCSVICLILCFLFYYKEEELEQFFASLFPGHSKKN